MSAEPGIVMNASVESTKNGNAVREMTPAKPALLLLFPRMIATSGRKPMTPTRAPSNAQSSRTAMCSLAELGLASFSKWNVVMGALRSQSNVELSCNGWKRGRVSEGNVRVREDSSTAKETAVVSSNDWVRLTWA